MVRIKLLRDGSGRLTGFCAEGHAGFANPGEDIVCAAVSVLTIAAANGLTHFLTASGVQVEMDQKGLLSCRVVPGALSEEDCIRAEAILETMALGLTGIQQQYGRRYVKVI